MLPLLLLATLVAFVSPSARPRVVASANGQVYLSTTRLADIIGNSTATIDPGVAHQIAVMWTHYQLMGIAGAAADSLISDDVVKDAHWATVADIRYRKYRELAQRGWTEVNKERAAELYQSGEIFAAKQILVSVDSNVIAEVRAKLKATADSIQRSVSADMFRRGGVSGTQFAIADLGVFAPGAMVAKFEAGLRNTPHGTVSTVIETEFGYHIVYRPRFEEVADSLMSVASDRNFVLAESAYVHNLEKEYQVTVTPGVEDIARTIAKSFGAVPNDSRVLVRYKGGVVSASSFAKWIEAFPPSSGLIGMTARGTDEQIRSALRRVARSEIELKLADSAGVVVDSAESASLAHALFAELNMNWSALGIGPSDLSVATTKAARERLAYSRIEDYFDRMIKEEVPLVRVPPVLARALRFKYKAQINDAFLEEAVAKAVAVRGTMDSVRSQSAPVPGRRPEARPTPKGLLTPLRMQNPPSDSATK